MDLMIQKSSKAEDVESAKAARASYEASLSTAFEGYNPGQAKGSCACAAVCACSGVENFVERMHSACEGAVGSVQVGRKFSRSWWDEEVKEAVSARREAYGKFLAGADDEEKAAGLWAAFVKLRRSCARLVTQKKKKDWAQLMEQIEEAYKRDHKKLYQLVGRFLPTGKRAEMEPVRRKDGTMARTEEEIMEAWADHQESLGAPKVHPLEDVLFAERTRVQVDDLAKLSKQVAPTWMDRAFTTEELKPMVESLGYWKASTADGTTNPMLRCGGDTMLGLLCTLFNHLRAKELMYKGWQESSGIGLSRVTTAALRSLVAWVSSISRCGLGGSLSTLRPHLGRDRGDSGATGRRWIRRCHFTKCFAGASGRVIPPSCASSTSERRSTRCGTTACGRPCGATASEGRPGGWSGPSTPR